MKVFLVLLPFLLGCSDRIPQPYYSAKLVGPVGKVCYQVTYPEDLTGYYCLHYQGKTEEDSNDREKEESK